MIALVKGVPEIPFSAALIKLGEPLTDTTHCPRCELRHMRVRWFPMWVEGWQWFRCEVCGYEVKDR